MEDFLKRVGGKDGPLPIPEANKDVVLNAASYCEKRAKSKSKRPKHDSCYWEAHHLVSSEHIGDHSCDALNEYLAQVGHSPTFRANDGCVVFDEDAYHGRSLLTAQHQNSVKHFCGVSDKADCREWWQSPNFKRTYNYYCLFYRCRNETWRTGTRSLMIRSWFTFERARKSIDFWHISIWCFILLTPL